MLGKKATLTGNAMIDMSHIGQRVVRPLLYLGLYLAEEKLDKLSNTILLLKHVLERLCVPWVHGEVRRKMIMSLANRERRVRPFYNVRQ